MIVDWYCQRCSGSGRIIAARTADVYTVVNKLRAAHAKVAKDWSGCDQGSSAVRVLLPEERPKRRTKR